MHHLNVACTCLFVKEKYQEEISYTLYKLVLLLELFVGVVPPSSMNHVFPSFDQSSVDGHFLDSHLHNLQLCISQCLPAVDVS